MDILGELLDGLAWWESALEEGYLLRINVLRPRDGDFDVKIPRFVMPLRGHAVTIYDLESIYMIGKLATALAKSISKLYHV